MDRARDAGVRVARFNLTPLKSTALHHPTEIHLDERGAAGDRTFFCVQEDGRRLSGISKAPLLGIVASYDRVRDRLSLRLPGGAVVDADAAATGEPVEVEFFGGRKVQARWVNVDGDAAEALASVMARRVRLARLERPEDDRVGEPVTILSLASVEELRLRSGMRDELDARRFRMLIELEGGAPFQEEGWLGRRLRIGAAELAVRRTVSRCVMTTLHPDSGAQDVPMLELLAQHKGRADDGGLALGAYADVERPGAVRVGDPVEVLGYSR